MKTADPEIEALLAELRQAAAESARVASEGETRWDRLADRVAAIGGSWAFIITFLAVLIGWMLLNSGILERWNLSFDPYPYIFLNLMMSMIAALQAPVIMMSQNRQSARDRIAAADDYEVNLKAELEIAKLHEKIDAMRIDQLEAINARQAEIIELLQRRSP